MASEKPVELMDDDESIKVLYEGKEPIRAVRIPTVPALVLPHNMKSLQKHDKWDFVFTPELCIRPDTSINVLDEPC